MPSDYDLQRQQLVERIRASTQIEDERILNAFARVPRHEFLSRSAERASRTKIAPYRWTRGRP